MEKKPIRLTNRVEDGDDDDGGEGGDGGDDQGGQRRVPPGAGAGGADDGAGAGLRDVAAHGALGRTVRSLSRAGTGRRRRRRRRRTAERVGVWGVRRMMDCGRAASSGCRCGWSEYDQASAILGPSFPELCNRPWIHRSANCMPHPSI